MEEHIMSQLTFVLTSTDSTIWEDFPTDLITISSDPDEIYECASAALIQLHQNNPASFSVIMDDQDTHLTIFTLRDNQMADENTMQYDVPFSIAQTVDKVFSEKK